MKSVVSVQGICKSYGKVQALKELGFSVAPGELYGIIGPDGAGKTTFTRALLRACGVTGRVRSPTFELVEDYEIGRALEFHHFDFYRFESPEEFDEAGFRELFGPGMVTACEWSDKAAPYLPEADLEITLAVEGLSRHAKLAAYSNLGRLVLAEAAS